MLKADLRGIFPLPLSLTSLFLSFGSEHSRKSVKTLAEHKLKKVTEFRDHK